MPRRTNPGEPGVARGRWPGHLTVRAYVVGGFAICVSVLATMIWAATDAAYRRDRERVIDDLRAAADGAAAWLDPATGNVETLLSSLASDPSVASLDPAQCETVFDALASGAAAVHLHVLDPDGREVCSLRLPQDDLDPRPLPRGTWASEAVERGGFVISEPLEDPLSDRIALIYAMPIGTEGSVLAAVVYTGEPPIDIPGLPDDVRLVALDADRDLVVATSAGTGIRPGEDVRGTDLARPVRRDAVHDLDGVERYYQEAVVPTLGWHVLAGTDSHEALAAAHSQRKWMLGIGGAVVAVVVLLGAIILGGLVRPLRRFATALRRSGEGDDAARAPRDGPAELVDAAELFNSLIEDRITREAELAWRAMHDALTGLPNRVALLDRLETAVARREPSAVLFLDLDRFKLVNDVHGHAVGDELLVVLAASLEAAMGGDAMLARFGGDEFVVLCDDVADDERASEIAQAMLDVICAPFLLTNGLHIFVTGSIGIARWSPGETALDMLRNADTAMYRSKSAGSGGFRLFDADMRAWNVERLNVEHDLHRALERDELVVQYQPIRHLDGPAAPRVEALVRWQHPTRGLLYPGAFLDVAEEAGLVSAIGASVLTQATAMAAGWPDLAVSVNVSAVQLAGGILIEQVHAALEASGLPPHRLCVEVTETGLVDDLDAAADVLSGVRAMGVKVALDDFGTGWSSLSWLQLLPLDEVKVDRSFVARLTDDAVSRAIVAALADLSRSLAVELVAEGVETDEQLAALRTFGITTAQGYLLGRPMAAEHLPTAFPWSAAMLEPQT